MSNKVQRFIEAEGELSQLKHQLKAIHRISIEESVVLFKVYEAEKISGKELRNMSHFEMPRDIGKIDVIIRKVCKKELISKLCSGASEKRVFYFYSTFQKKSLDKIIKEIEALSVIN